MNQINKTHDLLRVLLLAKDMPTREMIKHVVDCYELAQRAEAASKKVDASTQTTRAPALAPLVMPVIERPPAPMTPTPTPPPTPVAPPPLVVADVVPPVARRLMTREEAQRVKSPFKSDMWYLAAGGVEGSMKSRDSLIRNLPGGDVRRWREFDAPSNAGRQSVAYHIRKWSSWTSELSEQDAIDASAVIGEVKSGVNNGVMRANATTDDMYREKFEKYEALRAKIRSGEKKPNFWNLFLAVLPPRRTGDLEHFFIVAREADAPATGNYYAKHENLLVFREYKTAAKYGEQRYFLTKESLPFCEQADIDLGKSMMEAMPIGHAPTSSNYTMVIKRANDNLNTNDARHWWSSKFRTADRKTYLALCVWLAHSPGEDVLGYSVDV